MLILMQTRGDADIGAQELMSPVRTVVACDVGADAPGSPDRPLVTEEEYSHLPGDLRLLHDRLMSAPEGMKDIIIPVPPGMFLHEGSIISMSFKDFKDILHHSSSDRWLDVSFITIFLMLVTQNYFHYCIQLKYNSNVKF